jgi:hypothetical protein
MARKKTTDNKPTALQPKSGGFTVDDIKELLTAPPTATNGAQATVSHLDRRKILAAAEGVFQWRQCAREGMRSGGHIASLVSVLTNAGRPFEPLLVFPAGGKYFVMDGHHRLAAYEAAGWDEPVPVEVFPGDLESARMTALQCNCRDKLPMTKDEKLEAAWRLVKEESGVTKQKLVELGLVSNGTAGNMRAKWREIRNAGEDHLQRMSWRQARWWKPGPVEQEEDEQWRERMIRELVDRLVKTGIATELGKNTDFLLEALFRIAPDFGRYVVGQLDPRDVTEWLEEMQSYCEDDPILPDADEMTAI